MQYENVADCYTMKKIPKVYTQGMEITDLFAANLIKLREDRGWSAKELGIRSGVTAKHIYDLESKLRKPSLGLLVRIAKELGVSIEALLEGEEVKPVSLPMSRIAARIASIPDAVYVEAEKIDVKDDIWNVIKGMLEIRAQEIKDATRASQV